MSPTSLIHNKPSRFGVTESLEIVLHCFDGDPVFEWNLLDVNLSRLLEDPEKKTCKNSAKHGHPRGDSVGERLFLKNCQDSGKGLSYYERPRQGKGDTWLMF